MSDTKYRDVRIDSMASAMLKAMEAHEKSGTIPGDEFAEAHLRAFITYMTHKYGADKALKALDEKGADPLIAMAYTGLTHGA